MKKIFFLLASVILLACSENERMVYDEHMHDIYYSIVTDTRDSLYVSLLMADQILETTVDVKMGTSKKTKIGFILTVSKIPAMSEPFFVLHWLRA